MKYDNTRLMKTTSKIVFISQNLLYVSFLISATYVIMLTFPPLFGLFNRALSDTQNTHNTSTTYNYPWHIGFNQLRT